MAYHSLFNKEMNLRVACGMPLMPFNTKLNGPAPRMNPGTEDIIDEAFRLFRINVLFKNFEIKGPGDKLLVYLFVLIAHLFKSVESQKDGVAASKKLAEINGMETPGPKDKANFMANILESGDGNEQNVYAQYVKQLKTETIIRFEGRFFLDRMPVEDFKFWSGLAKKKFMGLNFMSAFG